MSPMITPGLAPITPAQPVQTPQSQYLAAALKQIGASQPANPTALGLDLGASGLMQMAQHRDAQYGANGGNAQKNTASDALAKSLANMDAAMPGPGVGFQQAPALATAAPKPFSGLMGLGKMFGGFGG